MTKLNKPRKLVSIAIALGMVFTSLAIMPIAAEETIMNYSDISLSGGFQAGNFEEVWDITKSDLVLTFTVDLNGMVDDSGAHAWSEFGVRTVGYGNFNPTWEVEGAGVWLATDYDWSANTFDPDPLGIPTLDLDDKLILQKAGGCGEGDYNLPSIPPNPLANHAVWFDRDGVDQWQALNWGAIDNVTYNTGGTYDVIITLHSTSDTSGEAYMTINGRPQGFYVPNWHSGPADLMPAGMTFTGDMKQMQAFYGLYGDGAVHTVSFENIEIEGTLYVPSINEAKEYIGDNISHQGIVNGLIAKLNAAAKQFEKGEENTANNILMAFINEVEAQKGKKIPPDIADKLIRWAEAWIEYPELAI